MPLLFIGSGIILIITGLKGDPAELFALMANDFTGENNFTYWLIAMLVLGSLGYVSQLRQLSRLFVGLVVIVLLLDNKGFFAQLQAFIDSSKTAGTAAGGTGQ